MKLATPPRQVQKDLEYLVKRAFADPELETVYITAAITLLLRWHLIDYTVTIKFFPSMKSITEKKNRRRIAYTNYDLDVAKEIGLVRPSKFTLGAKSYYQTVIHECAHAVAKGHTEASPEWYERQFGWEGKRRLEKDHYGSRK